jgi:hypothetical protein
VISPLRTAATTAALRRITHLLVFGGGRLSISDNPIKTHQKAFSFGGRDG